MLEAHLEQRLVLLELREPLPGPDRAIGLEPPERRPREERLGDEQVVGIGAFRTGRLRRLPGEDGQIGTYAVGALVGPGARQRRELEQPVLDP